MVLQVTGSALAYVFSAHGLARCSQVMFSSGAWGLLPSTDGCGRIQFLVVKRLRSPLPGWPSVRGHFQPLAARPLPFLAKNYKVLHESKDDGKWNGGDKQNCWWAIESLPCPPSQIICCWNDQFTSDNFHSFIHLNMALNRIREVYMLQ